MAIQSGQRVMRMVQRAPQTRRIPALELEPRRPRADRVDRVGGWWAAQRQTWLDAFVIWTLTRALFVALTYLVPALGSGGSALKSLPTLLRGWYIQDAAQLISIAQHGYDQTSRTAFFPLFPLLEHVLAPVFGGDYGLAGLVVANVSFFGALVILRDLAERDFGADTAHRTILYLAIFPTAFFFFAPYSASLFLCLSIGAFAALRQRRWWLAGALGGIAALASAPAVLLLVPFAVEFLVARRYRLVRWWQSLPALLIPAGTGVYAVYLQVRFHDPLAFWGAHTSTTSSTQWPVEAIAADVGLLIAGGHSSVTLTRLALDLAPLAIFVVLGALVLWRLPPSYGLYTAALLVSYLLLPLTGATMMPQGAGAFIAMLFPVFILLAQWGVRDGVHEALLVTQVTLLTVLVFAFLAAGNGGVIPQWW